MEGARTTVAIGNLNRIFVSVHLDGRTHDFKSWIMSISKFVVNQFRDIDKLLPDWSI